MTQEEILYQFYLKKNIEYRDEAIELLKQREFNSLHRNYGHWFNKEIINKPLKSKKISDVVKELSNIKYKDNESEPTLTISVEDLFGCDSKSPIDITSYKYTIVPFEVCKSLAKSYTSSALWKLKYQPDGKEAKSYLNIIKKHTDNNLVD